MAVRFLYADRAIDLGTRGAGVDRTDAATESRRLRPLGGNDVEVSQCIARVFGLSRRARIDGQHGLIIQSATEDLRRAHGVQVTVGFDATYRDAMHGATDEHLQSTTGDLA